MSELSDPEFRYYISACLVALWEPKSKLFGTFNCKTEYVKGEMVLNWSSGKINGVKKSLMEKGFLQKRPEFKAAITNADIFLNRGAKVESIIQDAECNLQCTENYIQKIESLNSEINSMKSNLTAQYQVKK